MVKHVLPVELNPNGAILRTANKYYSMEECTEKYEGYGDLLMSGIQLNTQFIGSYYNEETRLLGDFGSNLYIISEKIENQNKGEKHGKNVEA